MITSNQKCSKKQKDYITEAVAELAISAMLNIMRRTYEAMRQCDEGDYDFRKLLSNELNGKTLGIIGYGRIGKRVAELAKCFGMRVEYYSRSSKTMELDELIRTCDVISVHCPLTKETVNLLDENRIKKMKSGTVLINTSRAEICDMEVIIEMASKGRIRAYFDEIIDKEVRERCRKNKNIFLTPDYGWWTEEAQERLEKETIENVKAWLNGKPKNVVVGQGASN
ncbi:MAG: hypothetical protein J7K68_04575 [Candidatus Diapherotrites archaeon]|nr:hypothetical protein [Candidatus Diapherotrites archaeon]